MPTHLEKIVARTRSMTAERKATANIARLEERAARHTPRGFVSALRRTGLRGPAVIAELKKASPSQGLIRADYNPAETASELARVGAAAISVLTEPVFFQGSLEHLVAVSQAVSVPVLRKDFMIDAFQVLEARAAGADAILLIVAAHDDETLRSLAAEAGRLCLDVLCEVHDREELERAVYLGFEMIGVNCRNLKTLDVDPKVHHDLAHLLPSNVLRVAESGLRTAEDIRKLLHAGYNAFLIGETLMRQAQPAEALASLLRESLQTG